MDNLTHLLTGLMLSRTGLNRLTARAGALMMIAANAPDADVVSAIGGTPTYLDWHRGPTHSLLLLPITAAVVTLAVGAFRRPVGWRWLNAWFAACIGVLSHLLLDWTNIYGIRFLSPFSEHWFRLDAVNVVDPIIWTILLLAVFWPWLAKLVSSEIGAARTSHGRGIAWFALIALFAYDFSRWTLHGRAVETMSAYLYDNRTPRRILAMPDTLNPFLWRGLVDLADSWQVHNINLLKPYDPAAGRTFYIAPQSPEIAAVRRSRAFQAIERFSQTLHWRQLPTAEPEGGAEVVATDVRFANPGELRFAARAIVDRSGQVLESGFQFTPKGELPKPR